MPDLEVLFTFIIVYMMCVGACMLQHVCGGQNNSGSQFSPSPFMWVPRIDLGNTGSQACAADAFTSPQPSYCLPSPPILLLFYFYYIYFFICVCLLLYTYMPWTSVEIRRQLAGLGSSPFTVLIWRTELQIRALTLAASILYLELVCFFEICSCWMAWLELFIEQTGRELKVNLLYLSKWWDYRCVIP